MLFLFAGYSVLFLLLAWKNFCAAILLFLVSLPTYLIRFELLHIGKYPFPSTLLEILFGLLYAVWVVRYAREDAGRIASFLKERKWFAVLCIVFFISSVVSIFVSDMVFFSLGEWRAYFLEPMLFFLILIGRKHTFQEDDVSLALAVSTASIAVYAIFQKYTGIGIATPEWTNSATRRVTAFFTSPNAVGLYVAPIVMVVIGVLVKRYRHIVSVKGVWKDCFKDFRMIGLVIVLGCALAALVFTKSQGAWIGLGAGMLSFIFLTGYKKVAIGFAIAGMVVSLLTPSMRQAVLFQDQANQNRLRLWGYSWTFLTHNPQNFIFGTGVRQFFRKIQKPYYDKYVMERLIYPHNIFLNFWTEIGLFGMVSVAGVLGYIFYMANKIRIKNKVVGASLMAMVVVLVVHGLVDVPYFKNDLAFLFWVLVSVPFVVYEKERLL